MPFKENHVPVHNKRIKELEEKMKNGSPYSKVGYDLLFGEKSRLHIKSMGVFRENRMTKASYIYVNILNTFR